MWPKKQKQGTRKIAWSLQVRSPLIPRRVNIHIPAASPPWEAAPSPQHRPVATLLAQEDIPPLEATPVRRRQGALPPTQEAKDLELQEVWVFLATRSHRHSLTVAQLRCPCLVASLEDRCLSTLEDKLLSQPSLPH